MDTFLDFLGAAFLFVWFFTVITLGTLVLLTALAIFVYTIADVLHREDIGARKLVWILAVLFVPVIGLGVYWVTRPVAEHAATRPTSLRRVTPAAESETEPPMQRAA